MDICFEGIGQVVATFRTEDKTLAAGMAVALTGNGEVGRGEGGEPLCGVTVGTARGGAVAVQIGGAVKMGYSGNEPGTGWQKLACDGEGKVTADGGDGMSCLVLAVDKDEKSVAVRL